MNHPHPHLSRPEGPVGETLASELPDLLEGAIGLASTLGIGSETHQERLLELRERLREERFHLAVLGQFKRGKSTLLNALLGEEVLPAAVLPVTALPTFLRAGDERRLRIELREHRAEIQASGSAFFPLLSRFATEEGNPANELGVAQVEVFHPAPLLREGVVLIDTPGIGSTHVHNTATTLEFLPRCDAALFVTSVDPPMTRVELEFLREARARLARLFFVMNKIDYLSDKERCDVLRFMESILREEFSDGEEVLVFGVSARDGLQAKRTNDPELWERSGMGEVERHLVRFLAKEKQKTLERAVADKAKDVLDAVLLEGRLAVRSLELPGDVLEERLSLLEKSIEEARRQQSIAADLLAGDERRLLEVLEEKAAEWYREARERFDEILGRALAEYDSDEAPDERAVEKILAEALPPFFEGALLKATSDFERRVAKATEPHQTRLHDLVESVRRAAAEIFDVAYPSRVLQPAFEAKRAPYWTTRTWSTSFSPIPEGFFDRLLPRNLRRNRLKSRFSSKIDSLVGQNVESLRWALLLEVRDSFRRFRHELEDGLSETISATRGAIEAASARRREHAETIGREVARLEALLREMEAIQERLRGSFP